ncbi:MAG: queuosine precursor transporter [Bacteroidales bacterium]|nr:queuosine precursor transporter [Bacteroidales bacterium]
MKQKRVVSVSFFLMGVLYCICLVVSNLFGTKLVQVGSYSMTAGLIVFPISYIINDCVAEVWGFRKARLIIWVGFAMNFFVVLLGAIAVALPPAPYWVANDAHFRFVFQLAPRIAAASLVAFVVGSFLNAFVMSKMKLHDREKRFSLRAILSTLAGEGADSLIFFPLAFGGLMPVQDLLKMMLLQVTAKTLYEILALPITIQVVKHVKKIEEYSAYDTDVSYNPLKIKDI